MKVNISTSRKEKLNFLNDLKNGKTSLQDFLPISFGDVWFAQSDGLTLENSRTGETVTKIEFEKRCEKDGVKPITFK